MAEYYGQIKGRGEKRQTACGDKRSGISASVQTWRGSLTLHLYGASEKDGKGPTFELCLAEGSQFGGKVILCGDLADLFDAEANRARSTAAAGLAHALDVLQESMTDAKAAREGRGAVGEAS